MTALSDVISNGQIDMVKYGLPNVFRPSRNADGTARPLTLPLDDGIERQFKRPVIHDDGRIEYDSPDQADDINGYCRDETNPNLFHPLWEPCYYRPQSLRFKPNGCLELTMLCQHPEAETYRLPVTQPTCAGCVLRTLWPVEAPNQPKQRDFQQPKKLQDGTLVYPKTGWEPPAVPQGYARKSDDAWSFIPEWQPCVHREFSNRAKNCGCVKINAICVSKESGFEGQTITPTICGGCPHRCEKE